uniref:Uncharacterized protein n=1 Tax=Periophthalmus magnuspinnatus TaxID=409849 RepID=A0A3B4APW8_9GOBI
MFLLQQNTLKNILTLPLYSLDQYLGLVATPASPHGEFKAIMWNILDKAITFYSNTLVVDPPLKRALSTYLIIKETPHNFLEEACHLRIQKWKYKWCGKFKSLEHSPQR